MNEYKIRIYCTHKTQLSFKGKPINKKTYKTIHAEFEPDLINYIDKINILYTDCLKYSTYYRKYVWFTYKSLEMLCNREICEYEFECIIKRMHSCGFISDSDTDSDSDTEIQFVKLKKTKIQFVKLKKTKDEKDIVIYNYNFMENRNAGLLSSNAKSKCVKKYKTQELYVRN